jgi:hypothetical protein
VSSESDAPHLSLPNLVIVGVAKAGTTSLFHYLGQHRDICLSDVKELRYFSPLQYGEPLPPLETYAAHFRHCTQRYALEATPGYFYGGSALARGINSMCPSARTLVVLRSPEDRCWSFFQFVKSKVRIPKDMTFSQYLDRCEQLHVAGTDMDRDNGDFSGLVKGCYARWLDAWTNEFGDRFRVLFFDDLASEPRASVKSLCRWLDIDDTEVDEFAMGVDNRTVQYRHPRLQRAAVALNRQAQRQFERHQTTKRLLRKAYYSVNKAPSTDVMSADDRARLAAFYGPFNTELELKLTTLGLELPPRWTAGETSADTAQQSPPTPHPAQGGPQQGRVLGADPE